MNLPGKMVCGESNQIYVEKILSCSTTEKKCLLLIRSEKNCKAGSRKKSFITKTHSPPPQVSNGPPLRNKNYIKTGFL